MIKLSGWCRLLILLLLASATVSDAGGQALVQQRVQLRVIDVREPEGQILSYRHLAGSTEVHMRGTRLAPQAQVKLKIGSRPGFVELDINRGGISGLEPAHRLGKDFLTYVLWAVSVDGKASNLGEITFEGERPVPVNLTTPYQTFWLMVTAEPNYAVVDPSAQVVLYSVKQVSAGENDALPIKGDLFFFTHYAAYETAPGGAIAAIPNQLLQARKAVELAAKSGVLAANGKRNASVKEETYTHEAFTQAKSFLARSEAAYKKDPKDQAVVQFARTSAQSAENARALAMGAVGGLLVRQLESELAGARNELARFKTAETADGKPSASATKVEPPEPPPAAAPSLLKQPALWFAVAGWTVAVALLLRRRSISPPPGRRTKRGKRHMRRPLTTLRFLAGMLAPGGVLVLAAWAVQREEVVQSAAAPYAAYFCAGALVAAVLLSWHSDQSRLLGTASAVVLTVLALGPLGADSSVVKLAAVILLPLNLGLLAVLKERGVMTFDGLLQVGFVAAQAFGLFWIAQGNGPDSPNASHWGALLGRSGGLGVGTGLPWIAQLSFAIGALTVLTLVFSRRTKVEQGLLWALAAMFLSVSQLEAGRSGPASDALFFYSGTAGLVLVFAVLEHDYDVAYRDELTGLPGRRAFNKVMEQLGGTYAIAMCDVDHFKRFNDTYGHDAGDQVLRMVAAKLSQVGGGGRAFRYGGEEFLVVFRGRSAREAEPFVESLRRSIADTGFVLRGPDRPARKPRSATETRQASAPRVNITISIGLAERSKRHSTPELVLDAADATVYLAKQAGRNCLKLDESTPSSVAVKK